MRSLPFGYLCRPHVTLFIHYSLTLTDLKALSQTGMCVLDTWEQDDIFGGVIFSLSPFKHTICILIRMHVAKKPVI